MEYKGVYSPYAIKVNHKEKTITIKYNKTIVTEFPGLTESLNDIMKTLIPVIEDSLKNEV